MSDSARLKFTVHTVTKHNEHTEYCSNVTVRKPDLEQTRIIKCSSGRAHFKRPVDVVVGGDV